MTASGRTSGLTIEAGTGARAAYVAMTRAFKAAGLDTPDIDARFLVQGVLGVDGVRLLADPHFPVGDAAARLTDAARRRLDREPVSRILGEREFYGRPFAVTPDVLDPRPDTESVISLAISIARKKGWMDRPIKIIDVGAGSGAIVLTLLAELPLAHAIATDVSAAALDVTRRNALSLGVAERLTLRHGAGLADSGPSFDLVVSNPPYIPTADIAGLADEVRRYDPLLALDGGSDGLFVYREIIKDLNKIEGATVVVFEVGEDQSGPVLALLERAGGRCPAIGLDLAARERAVAMEIHL